MGGIVYEVVVAIIIEAATLGKEEIVETFVLMMFSQYYMHHRLPFHLRLSGHHHRHGKKANGK